MKNQAKLAGVMVGTGHPVRLMGVVNLSPESFFQGSVLTQGRQLAQRIKEMTGAGVDFIDVGAMSTAPYLKTQISEKEEAKRLRWAIPIIRDNTRCPISVDTTRLEPAEAAVRAGAKILNDITGLGGESQLGPLVHHFKGIILMAHPLRLPKPTTSPTHNVKRVLEDCLKAAKQLNIPAEKMVLDPGIGFFRYPQIPWWKWDINIIKNLPLLQTLGRPLLIGVSRKSFIGQILKGVGPEKRLAGSLAATAVAVINGAAIIRTHDVKETKEAILVAERLKS